MSDEDDDDDGNHEDASEARIAELVLLSSMYPNQLKCFDSIIQNAIDQQEFGLTFNHSIAGLFIVDHSFEIHFVLPVSYPHNKTFQVHCRIVDSTLDKSLQKHLNETLKENDPSSGNLIDIIPKVIQIWDQLDKKSFLSKTNNNLVEEPNDELSSNQRENGRIWIYSHHIKSSTKRKLIVDLCKELNLNGFMLIGKPGFICIEGKLSDVEEFWSTIRSWNWQRITRIETEHLNNKNLFIFSSFEEYLDRSTIFRILESKNCDKIIKNFLGIKIQ